ncbi:MAG: DUF3052 domain-containing protein [Fimbriimonas sp.]
MTETAGYSGTPLPKKLGLKPGSRLLVLNGPEDFYQRLEQEPENVPLYDVIVLFVLSRAQLENEFEKATERLAERGGLWIAWPKRASKVPTDVTEQLLRDVILPTGFVDNKVCAIDEVWSGLRFVRRLNRSNG